MRDEVTSFARQRRARIARRFPLFALGWSGMLAVWLGVFALEGRLTPAAVGSAGVAVAALVAAGWITTTAPTASRMLSCAVAASVVLGLGAAALVHAAGAYGEILAFILLTLHLTAALIFGWGWRAELTLLACTLVPCALVLDRFPAFVSRLDLGAAVAIGAAVALAVAEGTARDIRQVARRRRAQEAAVAALQASRDAYRDLAERAPDMIWSCDRDGRLTYVNEAFAAFLGLPASAVLGRVGVEFWTTHGANPDFAALIHADPPPDEPVQIQCVTPRGPRWVEVRMSPVYDEHGAPAGLRGVNRDVQERKDAEAALRASEERFRRAFDDAAIGMALTTIDGRTTRVNPALCAMLGYDEAELLRASMADVVHPDDLASTEVDRERLSAAQAASYRAERRYRHRDGHLLWVHVTASLVHDAAGAPQYFLAQIQDVTERHAAEEALRASVVELRRSEEKLRLLARRQAAIREEERKRVGFDLHDDVCQELVGVGILVESLRRKLGPVPAAVGAEFDRVVHCLGEVVEHLRVLARELGPFLLRDLGLVGSLRSLVDGMASPTLAVSADLRTPIPRLDEETEVAIYRIAQEALTNAVRHAGARAIVVALGAADDTLTVSVRDDGRGFDPAVRPAAALGLASMEERALALGGRLDVRSAPGAGTTVTLRCPLDPRREARVRELAGSSPTRSSSRPSAATTPRAAARD